MLPTCQYSCLFVSSSCRRWGQLVDPLTIRNSLVDGGGYNQGSAAFNPTGFIKDNNNRFVTVFIQYRVWEISFIEYSKKTNKEIAWCLWIPLV